MVDFLKKIFSNKSNILILAMILFLAFPLEALGKHDTDWEVPKTREEIEREKLEEANDDEPSWTGRPVPIWGNWCGSYYGEFGPPIDILDNACRIHDGKYRHPKSVENCGANTEFVNYIDHYSYAISGRERRFAKAIQIYLQYENASVGCK